MKARHLIRATLLTVAASGSQASQELLAGRSANPVGELNALYAEICKWSEGESIPNTIVEFTPDDVPDYVITYEMSCRGQPRAFSGTAGTAHQIWISVEDGSYERILDTNVRDLRIERNNGKIFVVLQQAGSYCLTADAAPCFLTLEFTGNELIWAAPELQHPSLNERLRRLQELEEN